LKAKYVLTVQNIVKEIIEPLGHKAKERNDDFMQSYSQMINKFTGEFTQDYCDSNGAIKWFKIVELNSAIVAPKEPKAKPKKKATTKTPRK